MMSFWKKLFGKTTPEISDTTQLNDAIGWIAEKGIFMVSKGFDEYPIFSDAALFVDSNGAPKRISYEYLTEAIKKLIVNNTKDAEGYPLIPLDIGPNLTYVIAVDFVSRPNGFRLVNRSKNPK